MKKYLLKAAVPALLSLASLLGCTALPKKISVDLKPQYTRQDQQYIERVKKIDQTLVKHNDPKKLDLEILVDSAYIQFQDRRDRDWWDHIKRAVENWAASAFKEEFNIEIEVDAVKYAKFDPVGDAFYLFADLRLRHDPELDGILAFTGIDCGRVLGIAELKGNHSMITSTYGEGITVQHELSHLYGALDIKPGHPLYGRVWSVMSYHPFCGNTNQWDEPNASRVRRNRDRDWKYDASDWHDIRKHINGFSTYDLRRRVAKLYCYSRARNFHQQGLELGKELMEMFPNDSKIRFYYSQILKKMKPEQVIEQYRRIIGLDTRDPDILNVIAWDIITEYGINSAEGLDAIRIAKKAVQQKPKDYIIDTLGWAYYKKGDLESAVQELERACESTDDPEIFRHLIEVYEKKKDYRGYCSASERLLNLDPSEGGFYAAYVTGLMTTFYKNLDSEKKEQALDIALKAYEIYPVEGFAHLVRFAYALNYERWEDPEFRRKYDGKIPE